MRRCRMCSECGSRPDFYRRTVRRARKAHVCGECKKQIPPGAPYADLTGMNNGDHKPWTFKMCLDCEIDWNVVEEVFADFNDEPCHSLGSLRENIIEALESSYIYENDDLALKWDVKEPEPENPDQYHLPL